MEFTGKSFTTAQVLERQRAANQPNFWMTVVLAVVAFHGLRLMTAVLISFPAFHEWTLANKSLYRITFFVAQSLVYLGFSYVLIRRFAEALFSPEPAAISGRQRAMWILLFAGIVGYHIPQFHRSCSAILKMVAKHPEKKSSGKGLYVWTRTPEIFGKMFLRSLYQFISTRLKPLSPK